MDDWLTDWLDLSSKVGVGINLAQSPIFPFALEQFQLFILHHGRKHKRKSSLHLIMHHPCIFELLVFVKTKEKSHICVFIPFFIQLLFLFCCQKCVTFYNLRIFISPLNENHIFLHFIQGFKKLFGKILKKKKNVCSQNGWMELCCINLTLFCHLAIHFSWFK
jgi:hypothetical protein